MEDVKPPDKSGHAVQKTNRAIAGIRDGLLFFLEAIGLRRSSNVDSAVQVARLKKYHTEFRKLISANNSFLETTSDMAHKILGRGYIDPAFTQRKVMRAIADISVMEESGIRSWVQDRHMELLSEPKDAAKISSALREKIEKTQIPLPLRDAISDNYLNYAARAGHLEMIGSLFQFFRQMDAAMTSENSIDLIKEAFLTGDYDLKILMAQKQP